MQANAAKLLNLNEIIVVTGFRWGVIMARRFGPKKSRIRSMTVSRGLRGTAPHALTNK